MREGLNWLINRIIEKAKSERASLFLLVIVAF